MSHTFIDMKQANGYVAILPVGTAAMINGRAYRVASIRGTRVWQNLSGQEATYMVRSSTERTYHCGTRNDRALQAVVRD